MHTVQVQVQCWAGSEKASTESSIPAVAIPAVAITTKNHWRTVLLILSKTEGKFVIRKGPIGADEENLTSIEVVRALEFSSGDHRPFRTYKN